MNNHVALPSGVSANFWYNIHFINLDLCQGHNYLFSLVTVAAVATNQDTLDSWDEAEMSDSVTPINLTYDKSPEVAQDEESPAHPTALLSDSFLSQLSQGWRNILFCLCCFFFLSCIYFIILCQHVFL